MPKTIDLPQTIRNILEQSQHNADPALTVWETLRLGEHEVPIETVREIVGRIDHE
jgi:hypothetical protein